MWQEQAQAQDAVASRARVARRSPPTTTPVSENAFAEAHQTNANRRPPLDTITNAADTPMSVYEREVKAFLEGDESDSDSSSDGSDDSDGGDSSDGDDDSARDEVSDDDDEVDGESSGSEADGESSSDGESEGGSDDAVDACHVELVVLDDGAQQVGDGVAVRITIGAHSDPAAGPAGPVEPAAKRQRRSWLLRLLCPWPAANDA